MKVKDLSIKDYNYLLPTERIASYPLKNRDDSKLLIYSNGYISESHYHSIDKNLPENSFLVFNDTRVVEARLLFQKPSGGNIEIFCLEPHEQYGDVTTAMLQKGKVTWECLVGGASKWKPGQILEKKIDIDGNPLILRANYIEKKPACFTIEMSWTPAEYNFAEILHYAGAITLPPYIKRAAEEGDAERYQTIYANNNGSVAAPTAGLHFTKTVFLKLAAKKIVHEFLTLHVGAGTFKPVKADSIRAHEMHAEFIDISKKTIESIFHNLDNRIVAVGTTSFRTLETLYWLGIKIILDPSISPSSLFLSQWEAYELAGHTVSTSDSLYAVLKWMSMHNLDQLVTKTQILIAPGYETKMVNGLITNFHQPQSTLLLLIAAFIGGDWKKVYDYALQGDYRFLSYGDGCLLWRKEH